MIILFFNLWLLCLWVSYGAIRVFFGYAGKCEMFPEGRRWWQLPAQMASLALFALVVLYHPWGTLFERLTS